MLKSLFELVRERCRAKRAALFRQCLRPSASDRILDLGGGYGDFFATVVPFRANVWIAEVDTKTPKRAARHGFCTALIPTDGSLPFPDGYFEIVHCNSVIEHVVVPEQRARPASEIRRVGRRWFVQTSNRYFPLEPHTRLPLGRWLLRTWLEWWRPRMGRIWGYTDDLVWKLLDGRELMTLLPGGRLIRERWAGLTKSLVIVGAQATPSLLSSGREMPKSKVCV